MNRSQMECVMQNMQDLQNNSKSRHIESEDFFLPFAAHLQKRYYAISQARIKHSQDIFVLQTFPSQRLQTIIDMYGAVIEYAQGKEQIICANNPSLLTINFIDGQRHVGIYQNARDRSFIIGRIIRSIDVTYKISDEWNL